MKTIRLTSPLTKAPRVKVLQKMLAGENKWGKNFRPGRIDGRYGPGTAGAVARAKYYMGYPKKKTTGNKVGNTFV